jgi:hypothetical protein
MDKDQEVKPYLSKYKDPEARKAYLNEKNKERYQKIKALKSLSKGDENMSANAEIKIKSPIKPVEGGQKDMTDGAFKQALDGLKDIAGDDDDPVIKTINKYGKYLPLVFQFLQGFAQSAQANNAAQVQQMAQIQQQQQRRGVSAPDGWMNMTPLQRMARKYDGSGNETAWYRQGVLYDEQSSGFDDIGAAVRSNRPVAMENTYHGQRMAAQQNAERFKSMAEINRAAENEKWDDKKEEVGAQDLSKAREVPRKDGQPSSINEAIKKDDQPVAETEVKAEEVLKQVGDRLMEDNQKYLGMVLEYFKSRPLKQFEDDLKNAEKTIKEFIDKWGWAIPFQTREAVKRTTFEELEQMLTDQDPEKHKMIVKKKLKPKLRKLWEELQKKA